MPKLEFVEVILVNYNLGNNNYQQASKVLFTVSNKHFRQLITITPDSLTMLNTINTKFPSIEVWFTDQNSKHLKFEDNVKMALIIG